MHSVLILAVLHIIYYNIMQNVFIIPCFKGNWGSERGCVVLQMEEKKVRIYTRGMGLFRPLNQAH